ncbi:hypothetical protein E4U50_007217, partial [Claviceps purpurea]
MPAVSNVPVAFPDVGLPNVTLAISTTYNRLKQHAAAVRPRPRTPTRPAIKSTFLTRDNGGLQFHRPGPRLGESSSQEAARNERERIQRCHRAVRRDRDAQPPSLTPTASAIYARDHQMAASPIFGRFMRNGNQFAASSTLRQSGGPAPDVFEPTFARRQPDDVFEPTSAQPRGSIAPSARSGQYRLTPTSAQPRESIPPSARSGQYRSPT